MLQELVDGAVLTRDGEGFQQGLIGGGGVREPGLLGSPIEEAESEGGVIKKVMVDDSGDNGRGQRAAAAEAMKGLL